MVTHAQRLKNGITTALLALLSLAWVYPVVMILLNSLKTERAITTKGAFELPTAETFAGLQNYVDALNSKGFLSAFGNSLLITVTAVALILVCCSMCAWFITRVSGKVSKLIYFLFVFSMVVPFQMLMFTLSATADKLNLDMPINLCIIYLGFGAGLAVFMFCGFMRSVPVEIEEAAMIDGCNPLQTFFRIVFPILKPTLISVGILETMWVWNDYLLPDDGVHYHDSSAGYHRIFGLSETHHQGRCCGRGERMRPWAARPAGSIINAAALPRRGRDA